MGQANAVRADWEEKQRVEKINGQTVMLAAMPAVNHNRVVRNLDHIFLNICAENAAKIFPTVWRSIWTRTIPLCRTP